MLFVLLDLKQQERETNMCQFQQSSLTLIHDHLIYHCSRAMGYLSFPACICVAPVTLQRLYLVEKTSNTIGKHEPQEKTSYFPLYWLFNRDS